MVNKTKREASREIQEKTTEYEARGGEIRRIPTGVGADQLTVSERHERAFNKRQQK